jgi:hypothetical protein
VPKQIKGNPRRKPPEPSSDHGPIDVWCGEVQPLMQPVVRALDEMICATVPDLQFAVKFHRAFYGLPQLGWVIEVAPYFRSANVLFLGGADLDPPPPLGTTGRTRYLKVTSADDADRADLRAWVDLSSRVPGWS